MKETAIARLAVGTQTLLLRDAPDALCRCGKSLRWDYEPRDGATHMNATCSCGMVYIGWPAEVKIEGIDRSAL